MRMRHILCSRQCSLPLLLGALLLAIAPSSSQATVYGCSIAGQWQCYPSPQRCYKNASYLAVIKFPNYQACQARRK
jgi:hypothetical protein